MKPEMGPVLVLRRRWTFNVICIIVSRPFFVLWAVFGRNSPDGPLPFVKQLGVPELEMADHAAVDRLS